MGQLVFQATLGGQVNLVGPNTASTFNLDVPAVNSTLSTTSGTETLTNKTLTTPVINGFTGSTAIVNIGSGQFYKDTAGNIGVGVTPSVYSTGKVVEVGYAGNAFWGYSANTNLVTQNTNLVAGTFKYSSTNPASYYQQSAGVHSWGIAPSGTAGNTIIFTQAMTLTAAGELLVGTTTATGVLTLKGTSQAVHQYTGSTGGFSFGQYNSSGDASINNGANAPLLFATNNTERARITSDGNLLVGTTSNGLIAARTCITSTVGEYGTAYQSPSNGGVYYHIVFGQNTTNVGSITSTGGVTTYAVASDYRLKTVIGAVSGAGERIDALEPIEYEWKVDGSRTRGFLAHKFQEIYAGSVVGAKDAVDAEGKPVYQQMQAGTAEVIADLVAEIQSLRQRVAQLESN